MGKNANAPRMGRAPSAKLAKSRAIKKKATHKSWSLAMQTDAAFRKRGGYGASVVSINDVPPGGMKNSPAYKKVMARCAAAGLPTRGNTLPPAKDRAGAAVSGGFPPERYPPNVLVDAERGYWLPDNWAQAIKNTGPGGTYLGWVSPKGKFYYHRKGYPSSIEPECFGRSLTAVDGFNGILRSVRRAVPERADKRFLRECLSPAERKQVVSARRFHFGVVSARRATIEAGIHAAMVVEAHFRIVGIRPRWYVDAESLQAYKALGLDAKVGGKLTPARNMVLDDARKQGKVCVQVSDDISKWEFFDVAKQNLSGEKTFHKANFALAGARRHVVSPLAAAQFILAKMRSSPLKPKLGGVYPTANASLTMGFNEYSTKHFVLGDFFVVEPSSTCRFDNDMTLKEDYDFTAAHLDKYGSILRCNRFIVHARHATNKGGAVATRNNSGSKERYNIKILQQKWPGVFKPNKKRPDEVLMCWEHHDTGPATATVPTADKGVKNAIVKPAVKKTALKWKASTFNRRFPLNAVLRYTGALSTAAYLNKRCKACHGKRVQQALGQTFVDTAGVKRLYTQTDLKYDVSGGRLKLLKRKVRG